MGENVKSLKKENDELRDQVKSLSEDFQRFKDKMAAKVSKDVTPSSNKTPSIQEFYTFKNFSPWALYPECNLSKVRDTHSHLSNNYWPNDWKRLILLQNGLAKKWNDCDEIIISS